MSSIFLGLTAANLLLLAGVFLMGWAGTHGRPDLLQYHVVLGLAATLLCCLAHTTVYTYFMATSRWLRAATDKAALPVTAFVVPSNTRKRRAMAVAMSAIMLVMLTAFAGAGTDGPYPLWPAWVHMSLGGAAWVGNVLAAGVEYRLIRQQGRLMDEALAKVNHLIATQTPAGTIA